MTTRTIVVKDNNTVMNEIAMMAIMISVMTSTTVTYVLTLNRELGTVHPMKPVVAWSTIRSTVPSSLFNVRT
jgi:translation initiation factor 2 gamma subunit (eIF-2gamma)